MLTSATALWSLSRVFLTSSLPRRCCFSLTIWFSLSIKDWIVFTLIISHPVALCPEQMRTEACALQCNLLLAATQAHGRASQALSLCSPHPGSLPGWAAPRQSQWHPQVVLSAAPPPWEASPCQTWWPVFWNAGDVDRISGYLVPLRNRSQVPKHLVLN